MGRLPSQGYPKSALVKEAVNARSGCRAGASATCRATLVEHRRLTLRFASGASQRSVCTRYHSVAMAERVTLCDRLDQGPTERTTGARSPQLPRMQPSSLAE
jgi:hypothetical protein